jgi:SSS family solute:Na+ symporter
LQLLGGVWIIQTLPAAIVGLHTRWFHEKALFLGWFVGIVVGTWLAALQGLTPMTAVPVGGCVPPSYTALATVILNFAVAIVLTPVFNAVGGTRGIDETQLEHYG